MASECICTFAQRLTGDGCHICNPDKARDYEADAEPARVERIFWYSSRAAALAGIDDGEVIDVGDGVNFVRVVVKKKRTDAE